MPCSQKTPIPPLKYLLALVAVCVHAHSYATPLVAQPLTDPPLQSTPPMATPASGVHLPYLTMAEAARAGVNPASAAPRGYALNSEAIILNHENTNTSILDWITAHRSTILTLLLITIAGIAYIYWSETRKND